MLFSYSWLKELSGTKRSPEKLAELLLTHAFEVESIEPYQHGLENVVIGKVLAVAQHPNADRLRVAQVSVGKNTVYEIVCGAPNLAVHQKVAVALPGAKLPGGIVIKESELRGVVSHGMICSAKELGLGNNHEGILVLPENAPIGKSFAMYAGLEDTVLDIKILPDRSCDALSYRGLAHEIAALEGSEPAFAKDSLAQSFKLKKGGKAPKVTLKTDRCKRYIALALPKVQEGVTPIESQARLILSGLRPISPLVDLTNILMLESGQPIHAFDAARIPKGGIVVRDAKKDEKLTLLDDTVLTLSKDDIVIADSRKALALAGVMGGKDSGIQDASEGVVFELAHFEAQSIRRTEKRYRLQTDAAYRFERGIDLARPSEVLKLLAERAGAWGMGTEGYYREVGEKLPKLKSITLELEAVASLLGIKIPLFEVVQYCSWLGLSVKKLPNRQALQITIPLRRPDLRDPEDIIEEIGRMRGYATIPSVPISQPAQPLLPDPTKQFERSAKASLAMLGFDEVMTYSFYETKAALASGRDEKEHLALANPMNPQQALMRAGLFPNLYRVAEINSKQFDTFACFEFGSVFWVDQAAPQEEKRIGTVWFEKDPVSVEASFFTGKGKIEAWLDHMGAAVTFEDPASHVPVYLHPTRAARVVAAGVPIGWMGVVSPTWTKRLGKKSVVVYAEFSVMLLAAACQTDKVFHNIARFPLAERDISLIGPASVTYARLHQVITQAGEPLLKRCEVFDVFTTEGEKSFAFHLGFGSDERTLSSEEMDASFDAIVQAASEHLGMRLKL